MLKEPISPCRIGGVGRDLNSAAWRPGEANANTTFRGTVAERVAMGIGAIERVYLVGAGASVYYGLPTLKTPTWELVESLDQADRNILLTAICESFPGTELTSMKQTVDYEELLNRLNPDALAYLELARVSPPESPRRRAALFALQGLDDFVFDRCKMVAHQRGPLDALVKAVDSRSVMLDVLLELAVLRAGREYAYLPQASEEMASVC